MDENIPRADLQACRVCLSTDMKLISLQDLNLKHLYTEFSGVPITASDGLPQHICVFCSAMLKKSSKFRKKCEATYYLLLEHVIEKQDLTTTIDRSHLKIPLGPTEILHYNCIPEKIFSIKEEISDTEATVEESCFTYEEEMYPPETILDEEIANPTYFIDNNYSNVNNAEECEPNSYKQTIKLEFDKKVNLTITGREHSDDNNYINKNASTTKQKHVKNISRMGRKEIESSWESIENFCKEYNFEAILMLKNEKVNDVLQRKESEKYRNAKYKCELCYTGFATDKSLKNHKAMHDSQSRPYECEYCHLRFKDGRSHRRHLASHNRKLACRQCGLVFRWMATAREHSKCHSGVGYKCVHCGIKFENYAARMNHIRKHHRAVSCDICHMNFAGTAGLAEHKVNSHSETPQEEGSSRGRGHPRGVYICEVCAREFKFHCDLRLHQEMKHSVGRPYVCDNCSKAFKTKMTLRTHILRVHARPRYPCPKPHCTRAFRQVQHLDSHLRAHSNEKNFVCDICQVRFKHPASLSVHKQTIHEGKPARKRNQK